MDDASCWEPLRKELSERGYESVAVDLPCEDKAAGSPEYAAVVVEALADVRDDVVAVGHSLGGITIPLVAAARPVRSLVWLCGVVRQPGKSLAEHDAAGDLAGMFTPDFGAAVVEHADGSTTWPVDAAMAAFYHDCDREVALDASYRLRAQHNAVWFEVAPDTPWPAVPTASIVCTGDRAIAPDWSRRVAREWLGVDAIELPGSHSPMISRPAALADALVEIE